MWVASLLNKLSEDKIHFIGYTEIDKDKELGYPRLRIWDSENTEWVVFQTDIEDIGKLEIALQQLKQYWIDRK